MNVIHYVDYEIILAGCFRFDTKCFRSNLNFEQQLLQYLRESTQRDLQKKCFVILFVLWKQLYFIGNKHLLFSFNLSGLKFLFNLDAIKWAECKPTTKTIGRQHCITRSYVPQLTQKHINNLARVTFIHSRVKHSSQLCLVVFQTHHISFSLYSCFRAETNTGGSQRGFQQVRTFTSMLYVLRLEFNTNHKLLLRLNVLCVYRNI